MEPWMDSLSEDWNSQQASSSPAPSRASSHQNGSIALSGSQSRIPHLANNMRKTSSAGSFLRHRSTHGKARQGSQSILRERSASSLNKPLTGGSQKHASLHSRGSNAFSDSQNSVQHHSIRETSAQAETPEWKKRLAMGDDIHSDGLDLFGPSKLEGVFKQPNSSQLHSDRDIEPTESDSIRKPFNLPSALPFPDQYSSYRGTRMGNNLEVLEEVNEEEEPEQHNFSAVSSDVVKNGSLRGLVKQRVQTFERAEDARSCQSSPREASSVRGSSSYVAQDVRWRSASGLEEMRNEYISPVTASKQNSIRNTIMRNSLEVDVDMLQAKLRQAASEDEARPVSSASDSYIDYARKESTQEAFIDEPLPDLTSQSLPDDLSMGTQDFVSNGGFINSRRGGRSNEASFLRKSLSLSVNQEPLSLGSNTRVDIQVNSSPPMRASHFEDSIEQSRISASAPVTPQDTSIIHYTDNLLRPTSSGSPLKLFGNRDTYTNNKLMRILSQFEDPDSSREHQEPEKDATEEEQQEQEHALRISQFGQGDLDGFGFEQDVRKPSPIHTVSVKLEDRIFQSFGSEPRKNGTKDEEGEPIQHAHGDRDQVLPGGRDRTTKRRKTVLIEQFPLQGHEIEVKISELEDLAILAGKKRKNARPGDEGVLADPEILASRDLLRPVSSRKSSLNRGVYTPDIVAANLQSTTEPANEDLTEALAAELATFAHEAVEVNNDSRKPSLATKDYMEEANKVMQFIRARGKPKPAAVIAEMSEPPDVSEVNPDSILDLDLDAESTKDDFSRPPSREHTPKPSPDRRHARHDSHTASHLRKYRDEDETNVLDSVSVFGTTAASKNKIPEELQESSPPNIRISAQSETLRKRKYSGSTIEMELAHMHQSSNQHSGNSSTRNSFPSHSSESGRRGVISSGTVSIPDHIGVMTFDHDKKIWVKKMAQSESLRPKSRQRNQTLTEDDSLENIPDLSIDEQRELHARTHQPEPAIIEIQSSPIVEVQSTHGSTHIPPPSSPPRGRTSPQELQHPLSEDEDDTEEIDRNSLRSKASDHEAKLHNGIASKPPRDLKDDRRQARVVTIAFSSPVVSGVNYANLSEDDFSELPREEDLPLDDSEIYLDERPESSARLMAVPQPRLSARKDVPLPVLEQERSVTFRSRAISPIVEDDEDQFDPQMSLVHVKHSKVVTPAPQKSMAKLQKTGNKASSILCLTPLSDFSVHQIDRSRDPDQSYIEDRKHPNALRQAHGSLALAVDELIKSITDAAPEVLFWDQLRHLILAPNSVHSVHGLKEYCPALEELTVSGNRISQLGGLPTTLRSLDIHDSMINNLTAWSRLRNLQYLDVSSCQLESLDGFSFLVHLRRLRANNNHISNVDGVLDLDGLLELELSGNKITSVDFEGSELTRLQRLDLSKNQLQDIKHLDCLPALEELNVSHNVLVGFSPSSNGQDVLLKKLRMSHNDIEVIGLKHLPVLRHLDIDGNKIRDIQGLSSAYHLDFLSLRAQRAKSDIVEMVLTTANECRHIRLSSNSVVEGTFNLPAQPQNSLRELEIAACGISALPERFGLYFPNCRVLNANFNAIKEVAVLRKMVHLNSLLLARNRIHKLRRTCLVMSRLPSLKQIDLRDNPLTVGFYSPSPTKVVIAEPCEARYHLPAGSEAEDIDWMRVLDEVTGLKRRTIELLLAEHCKNLVQLDGLKLRRERADVEDETWNRLTTKGVLVKPSIAAVYEAADQDGNDDMTNCRGSDYGTGIMVADGDVFDR